MLRSTRTDARPSGVMADRTHRELTAEGIARVADTYPAWRGDARPEASAEIRGFCKSITTDEIGGHNFVLTTSRSRTNCDG